MHKKVIRLIGFKEYAPEVTFTSKCHQWSIQKCERPGSDVEFLKLLFEFADIDYEVIQKEVKTSEEIIDAVENGSIADMSLISLIVTPDRLKKVAFTIPVNYLQFGYTVKEQNVLESDQFLLKTFEVNVYLVLTLVIALVAGFTFFAYRNYTYKQWLWITFASFFNQTNHPKSRKTSFLFLTGSFWFTAFLTICFYQARMKYFLTVPLQKGVDFLNMRELLDELRYGKWTLYEADNGYPLSLYCRKEQCKQIEELARMGKIIRHKNLSDLDEINKNIPFSVTLDAMNTDLIPNQVNVMDSKEKILFIRDSTISVDMVAFVINKNLTIELEQINRAISRFSSAYANIRGRYQSPFKRYEIDNVQNGAVVLTLLHFDILFYFYISMILFSIIIFGVEFLHFRYNWRNGNEKWMPTKEIRYEMNGISLSTDSTLKSGVNFERKTIKFFIEEKIAELQKINGFENH